MKIIKKLGFSVLWLISFLFGLLCVVYIADGTILFDLFSKGDNVDGKREF